MNLVQDFHEKYAYAYLLHIHVTFMFFLLSLISDVRNLVVLAYTKEIEKKRLDIDRINSMCLYDLRKCSVFILYFYFN